MFGTYIGMAAIRQAVKAAPVPSQPARNPQVLGASSLRPSAPTLRSGLVVLAMTLAHGR